MIPTPFVSLLALGSVLVALGAAQAAEPRGLPPEPHPTAKYPGNDLNGLAPNDPRGSVDMTKLPWRALGRLEAGATRCTAALVAPDVVLTAAHCLFDPRTRVYIAPAEIAFRLGYAEGHEIALAHGRKLVIGEGYDPVLTMARLGNDWALIVLDQRLGTPDRALAMRDRSPQPGDAVALGGYSRDRAEELSVDLNCRVGAIQFDPDGMPLAAHDCSATHGASGAPLLQRDGKNWFVAGVDVAARAGGGGVATLLVNARAALAQLQP